MTGHMGTGDWGLGIGDWGLGTGNMTVIFIKAHYTSAALASFHMVLVTDLTQFGFFAFLGGQTLF